MNIKRYDIDHKKYRHNHSPAAIGAWLTWFLCRHPTSKLINGCCPICNYEFMLVAGDYLNFTKTRWLTAKWSENEN